MCWKSPNSISNLKSGTEIWLNLWHRRLRRKSSRLRVHSHRLIHPKITRSLGEVRSMIESSSSSVFCSFEWLDHELWIWFDSVFSSLIAGLSPPASWYLSLRRPRISASLPVEASISLHYQSTEATLPVEPSISDRATPTAIISGDYQRTTGNLQLPHDHR